MKVMNFFDGGIKQTMKFERQIDHSEKLAAVIPFYQNGDYYFRKGISAYKKQNMKKAVKFIEKAIKIEQDEPVFHCQLAAILAEIGEYERSNEILQYVLLEIDETMDECYFFMANNYAHLGLFEKAETAAKEYMKRRPSGEFYADSTDLLDLLDFERDDEDYEEEDELILEYDQAVSLLSDGNYDKAVVHLEQMTKQYPTYWAAYNLLAQALFKVNNYQQAINVCHQILQEDEGNLTARCNLAMIYYKTGNLDGANEIVQSLQVIIPIDVEQRYKIASTLCAV